MSAPAEKTARPHGPGRARIACLARNPGDPYLELLYGRLAEEGLELEPGAALSLHWLVGARARVRWLHVHWPESMYRFRRGPRALHGPLSWLKLVLFAARLAAARALGYRIVWTVHQIRPHDAGESRLDPAAARLLAKAANAVLVHDEWTAGQVRCELGRADVAVVPQGSYEGVYPPGRSRAEVREELGIGSDATVFLCFGELRGHKDVDVLLDAFAGDHLSDAGLVVAGNVKDARVGEAVRAAAAGDPRIRLLPGFVPMDRVAELYAAADAAVLPRGDGGTSGSLILALALGLPVVAAERPAYRALADGAGWFFEPGDGGSLREALEAVARASADELHDKGRAARAAASRLDWGETARGLARLLSESPTVTSTPA